MEYNMNYDTSQEQETNLIVPNLQEEESGIIIPETPKVSRGDKVLTILARQEEKALQLLNGNKKRFDRLKTGFMLSLIKNQLESCDITSIANAFYTCCEYNLDPSSGFGKVYLIKYQNKDKGIEEVNAQIGYLGWMDLIMRRNDVVSYVDAKIVYDDDEFDAEISDKSWFKYKPNLDPKPDRKLKLTYAIVKFKNGDIRLEIATLKDIEEAMVRSKSAKFSSSPWRTNYNSMAKIVPLRRFKQLALSITNSEELDDIQEHNEGREKIKLVNPVSSIVNVCKQQDCLANND